jgi:alkanesulfonate monooxygenase SsuD/methylene tetrahydromethanopterin reductase-like flavin-dependent oxidoreductase (luciferase family)
LHWFLPTTGDSRGILGAGTRPGSHHRRADPSLGERPPDIRYLGQIARSAEQLGFEGALTPTGTSCEDAWLMTAGLSQLTERLKFLVAFRPGLMSPTLAAQMAATFQRISGGQLMLNVVTGGDPTEQGRFGDFLPKEQRYARADEFLTIVRGAWFGIRLHVIARATAAEAWSAADRLIANLDEAQVASAQAIQRHSESEGQRRMRELHGGRLDQLEIYPNLWAGIGLVRGGAGTALVGSYEEVAERIAEYHELGLAEFILSGYPHLEEAYHVGEGVMPLLRARGLLRRGVEPASVAAA